MSDGFHLLALLPKQETVLAAYCLREDGKSIPPSKFMHDDLYLKNSSGQIKMQKVNLFIVSAHNSAGYLGSSYPQWQHFDVEGFGEISGKRCAFQGTLDYRENLGKLWITEAPMTMYMSLFGMD